MSKAFTREAEQDDDDELPAHLQIPQSAKNYITPAGWNRMREELHALVSKERPVQVAVVAWAASNGDRSENGDYLYGKKKLREMDRRIRFLTKRLELAEVVDPEGRRDEQVFFGATVTFLREDGREETVAIVGIDEVDLPKGHISWISPVARTLSKARTGDVVLLRTPAGGEELEVVAVCYQRIE